MNISSKTGPLSVLRKHESVQRLLYKMTSLLLKTLVPLQAVTEISHRQKKFPSLSENLVKIINEKVC